MDNGSQSMLTLHRLSQGGYIVTKWEGSSSPTDHLLAATTIDEALKFIREKMLPIPTTSAPAAMDPPKSGNVSFPKHYDSQGYCDNPGRGY